MGQKARETFGSDTLPDKYLLLMTHFWKATLRRDPEDEPPTHQ